MDDGCGAGGGLDARDGVALAMSIAQGQATPVAGYYVELREVVLTPL